MIKETNLLYYKIYVIKIVSLWNIQKEKWWITKKEQIFFKEKYGCRINKVKMIKYVSVLVLNEIKNSNINGNYYYYYLQL